MIYITASGSTTVAKTANAILIQVNKSLTGTLTLQAGGSTFAIVTDPPVGTRLKYGGLRGQGVITVNPSATTDITVSFSNGV